MRIARRNGCLLLTALSLACCATMKAQTRGGTIRPKPAIANVRQTAMNRDLLEVTIPQLEKMYADHKYSVTEVVEWYIARIDRYNGIYRAVPELDRKGALTTAAVEDADAKKGGATFKRGPMWGVPMVIKTNTSIKGLVTSDGWQGFTIPGHELIAPKDAPMIARLRAAGVVFIGHSNMPDFAASDTNRSSAYGRTGNAYDVRFSPGGSSGGTVTAVTANLAEMGTGTDTANSIRMPSATSSVVGLLPTRGLVSIAGIAPLDWLRDNTGPIARNVTDVAIALGVMAGPDPLDFRTKDEPEKAQPGPYTKYLKADALKGKRFGVPAFIVSPEGVAATATGTGGGRGLQPETREAFMKAIEGLRAAGATVVIDASILPNGFSGAGRGNTGQYRLDGTASFLREFGPAEYHTPEEYEKAVGSPLPGTLIGGAGGGGGGFGAGAAAGAQTAGGGSGGRGGRRGGGASAGGGTGLAGAGATTPAQPVAQVALLTDPNRDANYFSPIQKALDTYNDALDRLHLDGLVYPATNMPPPDETMPQNGSISGGPHSNTGWVNTIGVPAIVVPGGFYDDGLPFGLEISGRQWKDGDLLGWAYAYEQATKLRHPPVLVEKGLLPIAIKMQ